MASWDIFCSVVDNFGDIGVTWRLARQLAAEHGHQVRLWVDEPAAFAALCPQADAGLARQQVAGVEVCHWTADWQPQAPADVVIGFPSTASMMSPALNTPGDFASSTTGSA